MKTIDNLHWRYATKQFDSTKKVSEQDLEILKEAVRLSATSYGLQLFKVLVVEDPEIRQKLLPASWGQKQIVDASHVLVLCNYNSISGEHIDHYLDLKSNIQNVQLEHIKGYGDFLKNTLLGMPEAQISQWTSKQVYIALANVMLAAAELKIDTCPMEGFDAAQYNEILGLNEKGLNAAVVVTVGYRAETDATANAPKVRKPIEELFETV
jgi:nitroreductase